VHLPERWGFLQFARGAVNATPAARARDWPVRSLAAAAYYAQHAYAAAHNGSFAAAPADLAPFVADAALVDGTCTGGAPLAIALSTDAAGRARFNVTVPPAPGAGGDARLAATVRDDRYTTVARV